MKQCGKEDSVTVRFSALVMVLIWFVSAGIDNHHQGVPAAHQERNQAADRKSTRLNSSHSQISYAVFCLKKKIKNRYSLRSPRLTVQTSRGLIRRPLHQHPLGRLCQSSPPSLALSSRRLTARYLRRHLTH